MKTNALHPAILILLTAFSANAAAQTYVGGSIGFSMPRDSEMRDEVELPGLAIDLDFDGSIAYSGAVGFVMDIFRTELELFYQNNDIEKFGIGGIQLDAGATGLAGNASSLTGLINAYFDFDLGTGLTPYFTAGIGMSKVDLELSIEDEELGRVAENEDDATMAYQLGAGFGFALTENLILDIRYRYFIGDDPAFDDTTIDYKSHNFMGGLRFIF